MDKVYKIKTIEYKDKYIGYLPTNLINEYFHSLDEIRDIKLNSIFE